MEYKAKNKYQEMKSSYKKLEKISTNNGTTISLSDPNTEVDNFFLHCYSFKEYLKKDASLSFTEDVEEFVNNSKPLAVGIDYHNTIKHAGLDHKSKSGKVLKTTNSHIKMDITPAGFVTSARKSITFEDEVFDAFDLATDCLYAWEEFLDKQNVNLE